MLRRIVLPALLVAGLLCAATGFALAQEPIPSKDAYDVLFPRYLKAAREMARDQGTSIAWMTSLAADRRARSINDLLTIRVVENTTAAGSADTSTSKDGSHAASTTSLLGLETKLPSFMDPTSLIDTAGNSTFKGSGATTRSGTLTATLTARVVEVLPNGDLVLEGAREVDINGDRQVIVMTGVVRTADILPDNSVLSARVGQMRIRYFGQGIIKDNLKPGLLARLLNKVF
jgi:flagellar L-ring protein FlgH